MIESSVGTSPSRVRARAIFNPTPLIVERIPLKGKLTGLYSSGNFSTRRVVSRLISPDTRMFARVTPFVIYRE
jgi:hypothetical protein